MIRKEIKDNIGIIILNRPEKRNALHPDLIKEFKDLLDDFENNENIKVVIITGEGKAFCAGADLSYLNDLSDFSVIQNEKDSELLADLYLKIYHLNKPVIAAVNGAAIAGGCGLASVCDFIVADAVNAKFGYPEVKIGFIPAIVSVFLVRKIGEGGAKYLILSGELIDANRAYQIGFVNYLSSDVQKDSMLLAEKLIKNSLYSISLSKSMINRISTLPVDDAVEYLLKLNIISRSSDDFKKGITEFLNKKNN